MSATNKPSRPEDEYFVRVEAEKMRQLSEEHHRQLDEAERARLKALHWMRCPKCGMELRPIVFRGVTVDKCFTCNGMYLDDGEIEKIAGKASGFLPGFMSLFKT